MLALPFVDSPDPASWPLLALTILIHTGYHFFLPVAYDHGDLGQVYPIARGTAPILVTLGALVFAGEQVSQFAIVGILCLAIGVMALTFDGGKVGAIKPKAVLFALATGVCIACYTVVDGLGARQAGSIIGFAVWLTIGDGILTFLIALFWKRHEITTVMRNNMMTGLAGGAIGSARDKRSFCSAHIDLFAKRGFWRLALCFGRSRDVRTYHQSPWELDGFKRSATLAGQ